MARSAAQRQSSARQKRDAEETIQVGERRPTQRERLLDAMIELAARSGYQAVSIAQVSSHAGVSSSTFYELFDGKEDCLLAVYETVVAGVWTHMEVLARAGERARVAQDALDALLGALRKNPDAARVLLIEARGAGPRLARQRGRTLEIFERNIERFLDSAPPDGSTFDIPATALLGGIRSVIARHLRTYAEDELPALSGDILAWIDSYMIAAGRGRWSSGGGRALPERATDGERQPLAASARELAPIPRGRHGLSAGVVARSRRMRLIQGTAEVMSAKGYGDATVADIVAAAGVARDVFYEHFTDKQHAFLEAQQHPTQHILDSCATAYFSAREWPERVWRGLATLLAMIVENPAISHLRLVECYAAGPDAIRRAEDITRSFAIFLEEGYGYRPAAANLPRLCSQLIAGALFETIQRRVASGDLLTLERMLPQLVYVAIAPFTGVDEAVEIVERLAEQQPAAEGR